MKQIKSEPVFGDQSLFDGMPESDVAVVEYDNVRVSYSTYDSMLDHLLFRNNVTVDSIPTVAIRRIISEPVWTKDQPKPPIGTEVMLSLPCNVASANEGWKTGDALIVTYEINSELFVCYNKDRGTSSNVLLQYLKRPKTPEEKYERECSEWARNKNNKIGLPVSHGVEIYKELKPFKEI